MIRASTFASPLAETEYKNAEHFRLYGLAEKTTA